MATFSLYVFSHRLKNVMSGVSFFQKALISTSARCYRRRKKYLTIESCLTDPPPLAVEKEYDETPQYPELFEPTFQGIKKYKREKWYSEIKEMPTVELKMSAISARRVKAFMLLSTPKHFIDSPTFQMYCTRTELIHGLPEQYQSVNVDDVYNKIKPYLLEVLKTERACAESEDFQSNRGKELRVKGMMFELISVLFRSLSADNDDLIRSCCDNMPRCESYWIHSGFLSGKSKTSKELADVNFQYNGKPSFQIRVEKPLKPFVPQDDPLCKLSDIKEYNYYPSTLKLGYSKRFLTSVPGFWPGDPCEYSLLSFHSRDHVLNGVNFEMKPDYVQDLINGFGIMSSFGWLNGLSTYQGFTQFHELTYPLATQTILTDGQFWTFFAYQLNTVCFHKDVDTHSLQNLCWTSGDMKLYETYEDGEFKMINDEVFKTLIKFFLYPTEIPSGVQLKPYLNEETVEHIQRAMNFKYLAKKYRNTPHPLKHKYEVPLWKHIYKRHPDAKPSPWLK